METKKCSKCGETKDKVIGFYKNKSRPDGFSQWCKKCLSIGEKKWKLKNRDKANERCKRNHRKRRMEVLSHYSDETFKCACCGEKEIKFLAIDHMNNDGAKHRKEMRNQSIGIGLYLWLIKNNFPEGFQVLCHNCNMAKGLYGECPHETARKNAVKEAINIVNEHQLQKGLGGGNNA